MKQRGCIHTKLAPEIDRAQIIVMNMCGRGDKDVFTVGKFLGFDL